LGDEYPITLKTSKAGEIRQVWLGAKFRTAMSLEIGGGNEASRSAIAAYGSVAQRDDAGEFDQQAVAGGLVPVSKPGH
jgi:hypothetical protein